MYITRIAERNIYNLGGIKKKFKEAFGETDTKEAAKIRIKALGKSTSVNEFWTKL